MAETTKYLSQYRAPSGEVFQFKDREARQGLIGYTAAQRALLQIAVMYLLPSYQPGTTYPQGSIVRVAGRVYKALEDTSESPVAILGNGSEAEANNPWQVLIDHDVNDGNWARLDLDLIINAASLPERLELALHKMQQWDLSIASDYTQWKADREADFTKMLTQKEQEYATLYNEALKTISEQAQVISEQAVLIERQSEILDQFSRLRFIADEV